MRQNVSFLLSALILTAALNGAILPVPEKVACAVADRQDFQGPDRLQLTGWVGSRVTASERNRLAKIDPARLLEGYRKRPGRQTWDGEHVGKWLHAGTLAWVNTGDPALRERLDYTVAELIKCQLDDGYLGTLDRLAGRVHGLHVQVVFQIDPRATVGRLKFVEFAVYQVERPGRFGNAIEISAGGRLPVIADRTSGPSDRPCSVYFRRRTTSP